MFKTCMTVALTFLFLLTGMSFDAYATAKKLKKKKAVDAQVVTSKKRKASKNSTKRYAKKSKSRRHRGSSVDLRALTTESPYTENPENGVTPVETKPGLE